jgi:hypothetical protein
MRNQFEDIVYSIKMKYSDDSLRAGTISSEHTRDLAKEFEIYYVPKIALKAIDDGESIHFATCINPFP